MRCPECGKFVSFEEQDPELNVEIDDEGNITGTIRIVNACAECSTELKEANFDIDCQADIPPEHTGEGHELEVDGDAERTTRSEGKGRYAKTFYGVSVSFAVTCSCTKDKSIAEAEFSDDVQASGMDELV